MGNGELEENKISGVDHGESGCGERLESPSMRVGSVLRVLRLLSLVAVLATA